METSFEKFIQNSISTKIALASFVIGTTLFLIFAITKNDFLLITGLFYVIIAVITNVITLLYLIFKLVININNPKETIIEIGLLLANIPISILYIYLIFNFFNI